jgi:hypothetical protein
MNSMRPIRAIATALLVASLAVAGCGRSQPNEAPADQPPAATTATAPAPKSPPPEPVVLADGRHPVILESIDPSRRTVTFDLIQMYWGDEATREAAKDHQESPPPNDYYIRNVNPKLRTLPARADAPITINTLAAWTGRTTKNVSVTLDRLATLPTDGAVFYLTVHHDQVVNIAQQYLP